MVASQGLEPQQAESESAVLPLHHEAISRLSVLAGSTGLEPATPGSTVQCANQLRHDPRVPESDNIISNPPYRMQGGNLIFYLFPKQFLYQRKITSFQETFRKYIQFISASEPSNSAFSASSERKFSNVRCQISSVSTNRSSISNAFSASR